MPTRSEKTVSPEREAPEVERALARGVLSRALKLGLDRPDRASLELLFSDDGREALQEAARMLDQNESGHLEQAAADFSRRPKPSLRNVRRAYVRLFGHTLRGSVCPYECEYGRQALLQQAQELADLAGFYRAFGLRPGEAARERPDHVACEFEFLEFLSVKESWALMQGDGEMLEVTRQTMRQFLRDHLARFGRAFAGSLQKADPDGFYGGVAALCDAFLVVECDRLGVPIGPEVLELCSTEPDNVPMACGSDDGLVQLGGNRGAGP